MPHDPDALCGGGVAPLSLRTSTGISLRASTGDHATQRARAFTRATAATATVAAALLAAGPDGSALPAHTVPATRPWATIAHPLETVRDPSAAVVSGIAPAARSGRAPTTREAGPLTAEVSGPGGNDAQPGAPAPLAPLTASLQVRAASPAPRVQSVPPTRPPVATPIPTKGALALAAAMSMRGTPYVWGGTTPRGFDCSGLVYWAFRRVGVTLPRTSSAQSAVGQSVALNNLQPGDLVFFYNQVSHVGIYVGHGMVLHAPRSGDVVKISPLGHMPFHNARRVG